MPCLDPQRGYRSRTVNKSGKRSVVRNLKDGYKDLPVTYSCGQCRYCRLNYSRVWAIRNQHESTLHNNNCFLTLTYAPDFEPPHRSLVRSHIVKFIKRLNTRMGGKIRVYYCGEYGEENARPHYHVLAFNCHFPDRFLMPHRGATPLYRSHTLESLWPFGFASIGTVTFESAAYVARYITKKQTGKAALSHYTSFDERGEITAERLPEFSGMSRKVGIGKKWFEKFKGDVFPNDEIIIRGTPMKPPPYYLKLLEKTDPELYEAVIKKRKLLAQKRKDNNTDDRDPGEIRRIQEVLLTQKMSQQTRSIE